MYADLSSKLIVDQSLLLEVLTQNQYSVHLH